MKTATVGDIGELICPECRAHLLTPSDYEVVPGVGACLICHTAFTVDREAARVANERQAKHRQEAA